jgi:hypothetical protein
MTMPNSKLSPAQRNELMKRQLAQRKANVKDQFMQKLTHLPKHLRPGNAGDINNVIWPGIFTFSPVEVAPNTTVQSSFVVNAEASFIVTHLSKVVFLKTGAGPFTYTAIDIDDETNGGDIDDLFFQMRDAQSARIFSRVPINIETIGDGSEPTYFDSSFMVLPNSTVEVIFTNNHPTRTYVPIITAYGSRVRVQQQLQHLGTTTGPHGLAKPIRG